MLHPLVLQWNCYGNVEYDLFGKRNADDITQQGLTWSWLLRQCEHKTAQLHSVVDTELVQHWRNINVVYEQTMSGGPVIHGTSAPYSDRELQAHMSGSEREFYSEPNHTIMTNCSLVLHSSEVMHQRVENERFAQLSVLDMDNITCEDSEFRAHGSSSLDLLQMFLAFPLLLYPFIYGDIFPGPSLSRILLLCAHTELTIGHLIGLLMSVCLPHLIWY